MFFSPDDVVSLQNHSVLFYANLWSSKMISMKLFFLHILPKKILRSKKWYNEWKIYMYIYLNNIFNQPSHSGNSQCCHFSFRHSLKQHYWPTSFIVKTLVPHLLSIYHYMGLKYTNRWPIYLYQPLNNSIASWIYHVHFPRMEN